MRNISIICTCLTLTSCLKEKKINYEGHVQLYNNTVECVLQNKEKIKFWNGENARSFSIYSKQVKEMTICSSLDSLFNLEPVSFINIDENDIITIFPVNTGGFVSNVDFLLFSPKTKFLPKETLPRTIILREFGGGWYYLRKKITLAD
jgi:hypothetical protein